MTLKLYKTQFSCQSDCGIEGNLRRGATIAQWIRLQPTILLPRVQVPSTPSILLSFIVQICATFVL